MAEAYVLDAHAFAHYMTDDLGRYSRRGKFKDSL